MSRLLRTLTIVPIVGVALCSLSWELACVRMEERRQIASDLWWVFWGGGK